MSSSRSRWPSRSRECRMLEDAVQADRPSAHRRIQSPLRAGLRGTMKSASRDGPAGRHQLPGQFAWHLRGYWMADPAIGGAILGEACHFVDLMYWLLDVGARGGQRLLAAPGRPASDRREQSGGDVSISPTVRSATSPTARSAAGPREASASRSSLRVLARPPRLTRSSLPRQRSAHASKWWPDKGYAGLVDSFVQAVRAGTAPAVSVRDGSRATIGCLEMLESARASAPHRFTLESSLERIG